MLSVDSPEGFRMFQNCFRFHPVLLRNSAEGLVAKAVLREEILDCIIDSTTGVPQAGVSLSGGHAARLCSQYDCAAQKICTPRRSAGSQTKESYGDPDLLVQRHKLWGKKKCELPQGSFGLKPNASPGVEIRLPPPRAREVSGALAWQ